MYAYGVRSVICVSPVPTGWVLRSHGDTTRGDGRHTDHRSNDGGLIYLCISIQRYRYVYTYIALRRRLRALARERRPSWEACAARECRYDHI